MLLSARFLVEETEVHVNWDHSSPHLYHLTAAEHSVVELMGVELLHDPFFAPHTTPPLAWDLSILVPPQVRLILTRPGAPRYGQSVLIDQQRDLVFNHGTFEARLDLRGYFQNQTHYITPVPHGPDVRLTKFDFPWPLQDAFAVGLQPDPEPPPPTLWEHLEDS